MDLVRSINAGSEVPLRAPSRRGRLRLGGSFDLDAPRKCGSRYGGADLKHAVGELSGDLVGLYSLGQSEGSVERAVSELASKVIHILAFAALFALRADGKCIALHVQLDILWIDPGQGDSNMVVLAVLGHPSFHRGCFSQPLANTPGGPRASIQHAVEQFIQVLPEIKQILETAFALCQFGHGLVLLSILLAGVTSRL